MNIQGMLCCFDITNCNCSFSYVQYGNNIYSYYSFSVYIFFSVTMCLLMHYMLNKCLYLNVILKIKYLLKDRELLLEYTTRKPAP